MISHCLIICTYRRLKSWVSLLIKSSSVVLPSHFSFSVDVWTCTLKIQLRLSRFNKEVLGWIKCVFAFRCVHSCTLLHLLIFFSVNSNLQQCYVISVVCISVYIAIYLSQCLHSMYIPSFTCIPALAEHLSVGWVNYKCVSVLSCTL